MHTTTTAARFYYLLLPGVPGIKFLTCTAQLHTRRLILLSAHLLDL